MEAEYKEYQLSDHFKDVNFLKFASVDEKDNALMAMEGDEQQRALVKLVDYVPEDAIFLLIRHSNLSVDGVLNKLLELAKFKDVGFYEPLLYLLQHEAKQLTDEHKTKIEKVSKHQDRWAMLQAVARGETIDLVKDTISKAVENTANILNSIPIQPRQRYYNEFVKAVDVNEAICRVSISVDEIEARPVVKKCEQAMQVYEGILDGRYSPLNTLVQLTEHDVKGVDNDHVESLVYSNGTIWNQLYFQFRVKKDASLLRQRELSILDAHPYKPVDSIQFIKHFSDIADIQSHIDLVLVHGNARECYQLANAAGDHMSKGQVQALYKIAQKTGRDFHKLSVLEQEGFYLKTVEASIFEYGANRIKEGTQLLKSAFSRFRKSVKAGATEKSDRVTSRIVAEASEKKSEALTFNSGNLAKLFG